MHKNSKHGASQRIAEAVAYQPDPSNPFTAPVATAALFQSLAAAPESVGEDAPEGSYEYRLVPAAPALAPHAHEAAAGGVEVRVSWGRNLLEVRHLSGKQSFHVGDEDSTPRLCDFFVPAAKLGATRAPLVLSDGTSKAVLLPTAHGTVTLPGKPAMSLADAIAGGHATPLAELPGAHAVPLTEGTVVRQQIEDLHFECSGVRHGKKTAAAFTVAALMTGAMAYVLASFVGHAGLLAALASFMPPLGATTDDGLTDNQRYLVQQYLDAAAELELEQRDTEQLAQTNPDDKEGGSGMRAKGAEGSMGDPTSRDSGKKWAVKGSPDNVDPHIGRARALQEAAEFGVIGLLNVGGGVSPDTPIADWGRLTAEGIDPLNTNGNMWGNEIGAAHGAGGLGLSGIGEGGGGLGEGIGLGTIGTIGHGAGIGLGDGFGDGNGASGGRLQPRHRVIVPTLRQAPVSVSGRIPPEVIQRIVRNNFGRFRVCYQSGLKNNPNLQGRVVVSFIIGRDGTVSGVGGGGDLPDASVVGCVAGAFSALTFPQPEGGIVTVRYPIVFTPGS
ncbi:MAG: AgmX/PglI C-terminal domain-containing protein [Deltaproteobacteria bacterium]|nr:AgmX/PglI C-terminal domain-containing protein [Deltaproteobacteria bacterium]